MVALNKDTDDWDALIRVPDDLTAAACLNNEIYILTGKKSLRKVDENLEWKRLAEMNVERVNITNSCLTWNDSIWVFGGQGLDDEGREASLASVERYDPQEDKWIEMPFVH